MKIMTLILLMTTQLLLVSGTRAEGGDASWRAQGISGANEERANAAQREADSFRDASKDVPGATDNSIMELKANEEQDKAYKLQESSRAAQRLSQSLGDN